METFVARYPQGCERRSKETYRTTVDWLQMMMKGQWSGTMELLELWMCVDVERSAKVIGVWRYIRVGLAVYDPAVCNVQVNLMRRRRGSFRYQNTVPRISRHAKASAISLITTVYQTERKIGSRLTEKCTKSSSSNDGIEGQERGGSNSPNTP